ncbi:D-arabinono-1,4-lactone oxidase [Acidipila sp. EB88]|uniref:D-arabinono-1,4-lactone oxidase n=1 Tax=Acidipila sp. EB88 TaxID=2305226 RepID=UPI001F1FD677|nr:D-arabinono-1,4-lactone oxidase [Acidipila sp. EB88]
MHEAFDLECALEDDEDIVINPDSHPASSTSLARVNWAGNYAYQAQELLSPATVEEVQQAVRSSTALRALGSGHSFNSLADTGGAQLSLRALNSMELDRERQTVRVGGGVTYGQLAPWLDAQGLAVHNLASLPHITVVGACATGTHGSGTGNGCLATAVTALESVDGNGEIHTGSRAADGESFDGTVVALGALGVVTAITLAVQPAFQVAQTVYQNLDFDRLADGVDAILGSAYSVSLFTDWQHHRATQVWHKQRVEPRELASQERTPLPQQFHGAQLQQAKLHPLGDLPAENCTAQFGEHGPWYERLPHFRLDFTPSSGAELQTEYFVDRRDAWAAIQAVEELRDSITPHLLVSELRAVAADSLWLSMAFERDSLAIHFTWKPHGPAVAALLPRIEARLAPFRARPHWAKLFAMDARSLRALYPRMDDFLALRSACDPRGVFWNQFLAEHLTAAR